LTQWLHMGHWRALLSGLHIAMTMIFLAALPLLGLAISPLQPSDEPRLMRRHIGTDQAHFSSSGEMFQKIVDESGDEFTNFCNLDFPMGTKDTNDCADPNLHQIIEQETMCMQAGIQHGASVEHHGFHIHESDFEKRPRGCFTAPCEEALLHGNESLAANATPVSIGNASSTASEGGAEEKKCFFYNSFGEVPTDPVGTPVCHRPQFVNGTSDSNGGCATGYAVIMNEEKCEEAANCLGYCRDEEFRIGEFNQSKHYEHPLGCFIHNESLTQPGCVAFNPIVDGLDAPTKPVGTPVCNTTIIGR